MQRQKRVAVVNDITGFGRCSIAVALPIISAFKIQCCPLPTAILSAHTGFEEIFFDDYTTHMREYMNNWQALKIKFDGICTGFLGSEEQIDIVLEFLAKFKTGQTLAIIDPVMGDYGKLYASYTDGMCREMRRLLRYADVITPNLTEACKLLDIEYPQHELSAEELRSIAERLCEAGPSRTVITGLPYGDDKICNFIYETGRPFQMVVVDKLGEDRSGTGDVFSAIVAAMLVNGSDLFGAVQRATAFISKSIDYTMRLGLPLREGICFEEYLTELK